MPRGDSVDHDPLPGSRGATLSQLFDAIVYTTKSQLRILMPATVVTYQAPVVGKSPALVTVQPDFISVREIDNPAELKPGELLIKQTDRLLASKTLGPIPNRPVMFLGHKGMRMSGPLLPGEGGLYVVMDRSIDSWINEGGPLDPSTSELHDLTDGVFIPGLRSGLNTGLVPDDVDRVGNEDGTAGMSINRTTMNLEVATAGPNTTIDAATKILWGAAAQLGVARLTDAVTTSAALNTFQAQTIAALNVLAAAVPVVIVPPVPTTDAGTITSASSKVLSE